MNLFAYINNSINNRAKIFDWIKLISITGGAQAVVQAAGLLCGIIIIRLLPTQEYAYYTIANTMLGTMTVLADGGISTGVMSLGGKVWQDKDKLGAVLATGLNLRKKFAIGSLLVSLPILAYLLNKNGANWITITLISAALIPSFYAALSDSILQIVPKLQRDVLPLQKNQLLVSILRLILSTISLFVFPWTAVALLANGLPRNIGNIGLRKIVGKRVDIDSTADKSVQNDIFIVVKKVLPGTIYYCFYAQISIFLISIFGKTNDVASLGALGRVSLIVGVFTAIFTTIVVPRFSSLKNDTGKQLGKKFFQIQVLLIAFILVLVLILALFSKYILWILGDNYIGLDKEFILVSISTCIGFVSQNTYGLLSSRGIIPPAYVVIPILTILQGIALFCFDFSTIEGVIMVSIFTYIGNWIFRVIYFLMYSNELKS